MLIGMAHLSWPWTHGDIVWMTALGLGLGLGLWHALAAPLRRGRRYAGRQLARLRREYPGRTVRMVYHVHGLADGQVQALVGRLRVAGAACESYDQGARVAASTIECPLAEPGRLQHGRASVSLRRRADRLALELDGGAVTLDGEVEVLVGSQQAHPRQRLHGLPRLLCERVYRDRPARIDPGLLLCEPPVIRNLAGGETVLVLGRVVAAGASSPAAGTGEPYRTAAPQRWLVQPAGEDTPAPAIAALYAGAPAIPMSPWARFGLLPLAWVAGGTVMMALVGALALRLAWQSDLIAVHDADTGARTVALRQDGLPVHAPALAVAATTPFHRAAALALLGEALGHSGARGRAITEARVAVAQLGGRCAAAAAVLREHRQPERAIVAAEQCAAKAGTDAAEARHVEGLAWMDLGHYDRASAAFVGIRAAAPATETGAPGAGSARADAPGLDPDALSERAVAHVLAGRWAAAAATLRRLAEHGDLSGERVAEYACLAEAAAVRAQDRQARDVLESLARSFRSPACALLVADLGQGAERRAWLQDPDIAWRGLGADARGKKVLYLRELLQRELAAGVPRAGAGSSSDTLHLLAAGVPGGDTPYEPLPALEWTVLESLHGRPAPSREERVLRMAMSARAAGLAAHLGQHERAAYLRALVMADAEALDAAPATARATDASDATVNPPGDAAAASWRNLHGDALLLAAVTYWRAGELAAASHALERARALAPAALLERVESVLAFEARGELHASLAGVLTGRPARPGALRADEQALMDLARAGDGVALVALVESARVVPNAIGVLAPALSSGHDALLALLHWGRRDPDRVSVAETLWHEGARAFAAERLGDHALAARVRAAASLRYQALARRDAAVLVYLLEHL
jgi:tetratricopeptide (TPR) repeat protein